MIREKIFNAALALNDINIREAYDYILKVNNFSTEEFQEFKKDAAQNIVRHHFTHNEFYKNFIGGKIPTEWSDIPVINKTDYQLPLEKLLSKGFTRKNVYINSTSGSSGHPFYFAKDKFCHALTWAVIKRCYKWHGIELGTPEARFYGIPLEKKSYYIEKAKDFLANRVRFPVFDLSDEMLEKYYKKISHKNFNRIYGYTSSLVAFARYLNNKNVILKDVCPDLKNCIVTSEVCTFEDRRLLERAFGVKVINEYGASETGLIAFEDADFDWVLCDDVLLIEIVDENNQPLPYGEPGKILITSFFNKAMPIIRYQIGDYGKFKKEMKGRHTVLDSLLGRENDFVILPSGKKSPGLTFYYISRSILEENLIKEFVIHQESLNLFQFKYVAEKELNEKDKDIIREAMNRYLEPGLEADFVKEDKIERAASGKIKHFTSEVNQTP